VIIKDFEGRDWDFDFDAITIDEWRIAKRSYKMTPKAVQSGLDEADPDAMTVIYWAMLRQDGQQNAVLSDALKPDIVLLNHAIGTASELEQADRQAAALAELEAAAAQAAQMVPTSPGGPPSAEPPSPAITTPPPPGTAEAPMTGS
jgi:hypothetical protein